MRTVHLLSVLVLIAAVGSATAGSPDPQILADRIDQHLSARFKEEKAEPSGKADDAEFLRRAFLDIAGRIPAPCDVHEFLADSSPDKRRRLIDELLDSPRYATHFADVWRTQLIPEVLASAEARYFQPGFEAWLRQRLRAGVAYDAMVRELLTIPIAGVRQSPESVFRDPERPNPLAFFAVKDARPENLASTTTRMFLGIQIECAQCHNHPFARWSREQFWNQAAFFAGIEREGDGLFAPLSEDTERHDLMPTDGKKKVRALLLDGKEPAWKPKASPRAALADWVTSPENPYFARATVNRLWGNFFGIGIVEPVDDFNDENPPSHPELLDDLAKAFVESKFDVRHVIRGITLSKAYNRTSARTHPSQDDPRLFARMGLKGLTGEQFFDSLALATGYRDRVADRGAFGRNAGTPRERFLREFAPQGKPSAPETSILQALTMMNGPFVTAATNVEKSSTLKVVCELPGLTLNERLEALYVIALGRKPSDSELKKLEDYVARSESAEEPRRLSDVFWMLLNSAEFRLNH
ncbi:DUF1549 and DUF1553 domain-containing protein [Zavarzinella formosa]|uniref:DUF1549 and DUF1553 domain-containing protein n=1 Tax=Zavarzinella formosa TaxID=360055 RepID=UPI0003169D19|nr:DUF1549 and DUF1553 domain-containing protein [Zavarzinella formosa]